MADNTQTQGDNQQQQGGQQQGQQQQSGQQQQQQGQQQGQQQEGQGSQQQEMTLEEALVALADTQAALSRANAESATRRKKIKDLEGRLATQGTQTQQQGGSQGTQQQQQGDGSLQRDRDRLAVEVESYKTKVRQGAFSRAVLTAAMAAGVRPDALEDIPSLVDISEMEYDEETGKVTGAEDAVKALLSQKKYLKKPPDKPLDDNTNRRGGQEPQIDEVEIARRYGLSAPVQQQSRR